MRLLASGKSENTILHEGENAMKNARFLVGLVLFIMGCGEPISRTPPPTLTYEVICPLNATEVFRDTIQASSYHYNGRSVTFEVVVVGEKERTWIQYPLTCVVRQIP